MFDVNRIRVFRSVVASGSVVAAADNLRMTSSAVSQHLQALQRETGLTLFTRQGRGLVPTEAALVLAEQSDDVMAQWGRLEHIVEDLAAGRVDRLTIGYFASAGSAWMPALVTRLRAELPDLVLELVLNEVTQRGFHPDLNLVIDSPEYPVLPGHRRVELTRDPFVVVLPERHPLAEKQVVALEDLRRETWVSNDFPRSHGHLLVVAACTAAGFRPRFSVQSQDHHTALGFVAAGVGISVLPRLAAVGLPAGVVRRDLAEPRPVRHLVALLRELGAPHPPAERALAILRDLIAHPSARAR